MKELINSKVTVRPLGNGMFLLNLTGSNAETNVILDRNLALDLVEDLSLKLLGY